MAGKSFLAQLSDLNPDAVLFDNMESAIIGLGCIGQADPVAVYSRALIYSKLLSDGLSREDADEYYFGNFVAVQAGEFTPVIVDDMGEE
jgi:hypothetical protein